MEFGLSHSTVSVNICESILTVSKEKGSKKKIHDILMCHILAPKTTQIIFFSHRTATSNHFRKRSVRHNLFSRQHSYWFRPEWDSLTLPVISLSLNAVELSAQLLSWTFMKAEIVRPSGFQWSRIAGKQLESVNFLAL